MERKAVAFEIARHTTALLIATAALMIGLLQAKSESNGENLALDLRRSVVNVQAKWRDGVIRDGFGFIVAERDGFLYIVTADHVVRGDGPDNVDPSPTVRFFQDQGKDYAADLLGTRLRPTEGDVAVLRMGPPTGWAWRGDARASSGVTSSGVKRGAHVWFIGVQGNWMVPTQPGAVSGIEPSGTIRSEGLNVKPGTSGAPLISDAGIVGMIVVDTGQFALATPIDLIARAFEEWNYPWQLTAASSNALTSDEIRYLGRVRDRETERGLAYVWSGVLQYVAGFGIGVYTFRVLFWVIGISFVGALYLRTCVTGVRDYHHGFFWCFGASLNRLLPVIEINREFTEFFVDPRRERLTGWQTFIFSVIGIVGWVLVLILIAAASGLTQRS